MAEHIIPLRMSDFSGPALNVEKCQCWLCANEKAALAAEVERLRAALELFACDCIESGNLCPSPHACRNYVARAALEGRT